MSRMAYLPLSVRREVIRRAHRRCEYCLLHADYATFAHEIDHVLPRKHGGGDSADNLAYAYQIDRLLLRQELYALGRYP